MIRAAVFGLGRWGRRLVESVQDRSDAIRFVAAVTRTPAGAAEFASRHGLRLGDDPGPALSDTSIDAVVLATPHRQHVGPAIAAAAAGKHVFIEKPLALAKAEADRAAEACGRAGVVLAAGHNRRFLPAMQRLREQVRSGELGTILHVEGQFSAPAGLRYQAESWRASSGESPAGGMTGLGIHLVDAMIHLVGPVTGVVAQSERRALSIDLDDTTSMLFRFADGPTGYLGTLTATAPVWRLQVFGSAGWSEMRGLQRLLTSRIDEPEMEIRYPEVDIERAELEAFAAAITGRAPYPVPVSEAIHGVSVLEAIVQSTKAGQWLSVP